MNAAGTSGTHPVLYFDGICNLCSSTVMFIVKWDKKKIFHFIPLQSEPGIEAASRTGGEAAQSVLLYYKDKYYMKSDAVLMTARLLGGCWQLAVAGYIFPRRFRDFCYDFIAARRYRWFGRANSCMLPPAELKDRFS